VRLDWTSQRTGACISVNVSFLKGDGGIPRGARVYGRVSRIINFNDLIPQRRPQQPPPTPKLPVLGWHAGEVLIQMEFSQIEYRRSRAPFLARLIDLQLEAGKQGAEIRSFGYLDSDAVVRYDPPGTASIYISKENLVLGRNLIMQWVTASGRGSL
jgi:hypothetical protein